MADLPIIDSHMHIFDIKRYNMPWMKAYPSLKKSFSLSDYEEATEDYDLAKSVYIEVGLDFSQVKDEVLEITQLCKNKNNPIAAMVISGEMESEGFDAYLSSVMPNPYIKGVRRLLVHDDTPKGACQNPQFIKNMQILPQYRLHFEICMRTDELPDIVPVIDQCPDVSFVLNHIGNGGIKGSEPWMKGIHELGKRDNVVGCKISGMIEHAEGAWKPEDLVKNFEFCLEAFGQDRILFGSNWPVCTMSGTFEDWVEALLQVLRNYNDTFVHKFFYKNVHRIYRL